VGGNDPPPIPAQPCVVFQSRARRYFCLGGGRHPSAAGGGGHEVGVLVDEGTEAGAKTEGPGPPGDFGHIWNLRRIGSFTIGTTGHGTNELKKPSGENTPGSPSEILIWNSAHFLDIWEQLKWCVLWEHGRTDTLAPQEVIPLGGGGRAHKGGPRGLGAKRRGPRTQVLPKAGTRHRKGLI